MSDLDERLRARPSWDAQFAEDADETRERWRRIKAQRKAEGKCWQCASPIDVCDCPNVDHSALRAALDDADAG